MLFCSLKLVSADGGWGRASPHSLFPRAGSSHLLFFRKPSEGQTITPLMSPASTRSLPLSCLHPSCLTARWHSIPFFPPSTTWLGFRAQPWALNFGDPPNVDLCWSSWEGLAVLLLLSGWSQKLITQPCSDLEFMVKHSKKLTSRFAALCYCLSSYAREQDSSTQPSGFFVSRQLCCHSQMHSKKGDISPYATQGILRSCYPLLAPCPPFPQEHWQAHQTQEPGYHTDLQNIRLCPPLLIKNMQYLVPVLFSVNSFGAEFFFCNPLCFDSLSLSLLSLWPEHPVLFSPKSTLHSSYPPWWSYFFKLSCAVLLYQSSDQFLVCPKWFDILLAFRGLETPTPPPS